MNTLLVVEGSIVHSIGDRTPFTRVTAAEWAEDPRRPWQAAAERLARRIAGLPRANFWTRPYPGASMPDGSWQEYRATLVLPAKNAGDEHTILGEITVRVIAGA